MATTTVIGLQLAELGDFSDIKPFYMAQVSRQSASPTRTERMITGRIISVSVPGTFATWSILLPFVTRADAEWLRSREGDTFFVRTDHGEAFFAILNDVVVSEILQPGTPHEVAVGEVSLALYEVTGTVAV